jgi:nuclear pore complex protein Nup205
LLTFSDIENPDALQKYYDLLLSTVRLIVYAGFSRGIDNEQIKAQTRGFLVENRPCIAGIFKRSANIGNTSSAHQDSLCELVKAFMALISATDFIEVRNNVVHALYHD